MTRLDRLLAASLLVAGLGVSTASAEPNRSVDLDLLPCTDNVQVPAADQDASMPPDQDFVTTAPDVGVPTTEPAPDELPQVTTRTVGPPTIVQPFANPAPAAVQAEPAAPRVLPVEPQRQPPGPPNRMP